MLSNILQQCSDIFLLCSVFLVRSFSTTNRVNNLIVATFNCKNIKSSLFEIKELCAKCDSILLQETWLLKCEHGILFGIYNEFTAKALCAVDVNNKVLSGRLYGGIAIL